MSNLELLEEEFGEYWETWKTIQMMDMGMRDRRELHRIVVAEFDPGYPFVEWCGPCIAKMLEYAFIQLQNKKNAINPS